MNLIKKLRNLLLSVVCACSALCGTYKTGTLKGTLNNKYAEKVKFDYGFRSANISVTFSSMNDKQLTSVSPIDSFVTNRSTLTEKMQNSSGGFDTSTNFSTLSIQKAYKICDLYNDYDSIVNTSYSSYGFFPFYYSFCVTGVYTSSSGDVTYSTDDTSGSYEAKPYPYACVAIYDNVSKTITSVAYSFQYTTLSTGGLTNNISYFSSGQNLSLYIFFMALVGTTKFNISCFFSPIEYVSQSEYSNINVGGDTSELESQIASLKSQVETLTVSNSELTNSLNTLQENYNTLLTNYNNLQSENSDLKSQIETLNNTISDLNNQITQLNKTISGLNSKIASLRDALNSYASNTIEYRSFADSIYQVGIVYYYQGVPYTEYFDFDKESYNNLGYLNVALYFNKNSKGLASRNIDIDNFLYDVVLVPYNVWTINKGDILTFSLQDKTYNGTLNLYIKSGSNMTNVGSVFKDMAFQSGIESYTYTFEQPYLNSSRICFRSSRQASQDKYYYCNISRINFTNYYLTSGSEQNIYNSGYSNGYGVGFSDGSISGYDSRDNEMLGYQEQLVEMESNLNYYQQQYEATIDKLNSANEDIERLNNLIANQSDYTFSNLFWGLAQTPFGVLTSIFNVDVMGVNIGGLITGILTAVIVIWVIKKFI